MVYNGNLYVPAKTAAQTMGESFRCMTERAKQPHLALNLEHLSI